MPKTKAEEPIDYGFVKLPKDLIAEVDAYVGKHGYRSRTEIIKEAIRRLMATYPRDVKPVLEHYNLDQHGVRVLDRSLNPPNGLIVDVYFKPDANNRVLTFCEHDQTERCRHVEFALDLPEVQKIFHEKGWKPK